METRGRALYNLIRANWEEDPSFPGDPWQIEDYRLLETEVLFNRLVPLGIQLDKEAFFAFSEDVSSPEELAQTLWVEKDSGEDPNGIDQAYLLLFEIWRRLLPSKTSLSIFCDQLDHLIAFYDRDLLADEEQLYEHLIELQEILDTHVDQGDPPKEILKEIALFCAHDLESFIYDYAANEIDKGHHTIASEIVDGFSPYIQDQNWFKFLQLRLVANVDEDEAEAMLARMLEDLHQHPDFELLIEIARFLVLSGKPSFFVETVKEAFLYIETEQDFQELLAITCEFYRLLDREEEKILSAILRKRGKIPLETEIFAEDLDMEAFLRLVEDLNGSEA